MVCSCQSDADKQTTHIAEKICECYNPLQELNDTLKDLLSNGRGNEAEKLFAEVISHNNIAKNCTLNLIKEQGKAYKPDAVILEEAISDNCPNIWESVKELLLTE